MAFREDPPRFVEPGVDCLQLLALHAELEGRSVAFSTYQDDCEFGLRLDRPGSSPVDEAWSGIYRLSKHPALPTGLVERVVVELSDRGNPWEIVFEIGGEDLILLAGEAHESPEGTLRFHRDDESILVFRSREAITELPWFGSPLG